MRGIHLVLLTILLNVEHALSLRCYSCTGTEDGARCEAVTCTGVCFKSNMTMTVGSERIKLQSKGCTPSCSLISELLKQLTQENLGPGLIQGELEVHSVTCCENNFCNGVARTARSPWALAGGLLLSLGPALWALL